MELSFILLQALHNPALDKVMIFLPIWENTEQLDLTAILCCVFKSIGGMGL